MNQKTENIMSHKPTESKKLLSYTIAEWACALKYEDLSPEAIQAAKLFWFDSIGCALGGSQQDDAKILLKHYQRCPMERWQGQSNGFRFRLQDQSRRRVVLERPHDPRDGLQRHLLEGGPVPSQRSHRRAAGALRKRRSGRQGSDSGDDHCLRNRDAALRSRSARRARIRLASCHLERVRGADRRGARLESHAGADGFRDGHQRGAHLLSGRGDGGQIDQHEEHGRSLGRPDGRGKRAARAGGFSGPEHIIDGKEGLFAVFDHVQYKGEPATFDGEALVTDLPNSPKSHYRILDCGMKSFPIEALSHAPLTAMMKTVKEHNIKADDVKEIKVEVIARAADILGDPHKYRPDSKETADHSLPYCMAAGLVDGMVTPLQFKEERVLDKALIPIMDKVKVVPNEEFEALFPKFQPSRVTITTNDGKSHSTRVDVPKGRPARSDDRGRDRGQIHRARRRCHRQGSVQEAAELHHEHGNREETSAVFSS